MAVEGMILFELCRKMKSMHVHFKNAHSGDLNCQLASSATSIVHRL